MAGVCILLGILLVVYTIYLNEDERVPLEWTLEAEEAVQWVKNFLIELATK